MVGAADAAAARRRVAPRSSGTREVVAPRSGPVQVCAIAELSAAAAGRRGSVGTIAADGPARSTASRSGNTPGSPDQPNQDPLVAAIGGYSPVIHNFHRFIHRRIDVSHYVERAVFPATISLWG